MGLRDWLRWRRGAPRQVRHGEHLDLRFESGVTQSRMRLDAPDALVVDYTRTMLAALLLQPAPRHVGMVGLGGGSQAKFVLRHLPRARTEAFEIDPRVLAMRRDFRIPNDDRLQLVLGDASQLLPRRRGAFELLLVDGYDTSGIPAALSTQAFVDACRDALAGDGVLATNLYCPDHAEHFAQLQAAFGGNAVLLDEPQQSNRVGFAWREGAATGAVDVHAALALLDPVAREQLAPGFERLAAALPARD
jgi:spermidine synthase